MVKGIPVRIIKFMEALFDDYLTRPVIWFPFVKVILIMTEKALFHILISANYIW